VATDTSIVISANANKAVSEFARVTASARTAGTQITSALRGISGAMAGLGAGLTFAGMTAFVKSSIDAADALNDLSKRTGVAATTIGGIGFAAQQAGGDLEGAAAAFKAFNKTISEAIGGNQEAVDNFQKLGITLKDLKTLSPDQLLIKAADAFSQFADGAEKAAGAQVFFGKGAASVAGLLDEGGAALRRNIDYYKQYSGVTEDLVRASDQFNDTLTKLKVQTSGLGNAMAQILLKPMQEVADYLLRAAENGDQFKTVAEALTAPVIALGKAMVVASFGIKALGDFADFADFAGDRLLRFDFKGAGELGKKWADQQRASFAELNDLLDRMNGKVASSRSGFGGAGTDGGVRGPGGKLRTPNFTGKTSGGKGIDEFGNQLERVKKLTAEAGAELDAMFSGEKLNAAAKALAQLSQDKSFQKLPEQQRKEIESWYARYDALLKNIEAEKALDQAREEQQKKADEERKKRADDILQFGKSVEGYKLQNDTMQRELAIVGQSVEAHQRLSEVIAFEAMEREANRLGITSELEDLRKAMQERLRLIDEYAAKVKEINNTEAIRAIFADNFVDQLTQVVEGTKSVSDAFKAMAKNIAAAINEIAAKNIAKAIFGDKGSGGGFFDDIFKSIGSFLPAFAGGTSFAPGGMSLVGERGPEIVNLPRGASVTPNNRLGGNVVSINVNVPAGTNSASADRIALVTGQAVQRALRRNG
jgi:hypothetical protein